MTAPPRSPTRRPRSRPSRKPVRRGARRVPLAAPARPRRAAQDAQGVHPAHDPPAVPAGLRVHLRVPEDRPGRRRHRGGEPGSPRCSSPASSGSRSCSRASSRSRCRWCRSSATRVRSRTACSRRCRCALVAIQKAIWGALSGLFSALLVFPIAAVVPATPVHLDINWLVLLTLAPLACYMCGALGLTFGTRFDPRTVPLLFGIIVIPLTFLGCVYYSWSSLEPIRWLQILVLANPLVYMCEGFRAALTTSPHMSLWAVYAALIGFSALFTWLGINGFKRRVPELNRGEGHVGNLWMLCRGCDARELLGGPRVDSVRRPPVRPLRGQHLVRRSRVRRSRPVDLRPRHRAAQLRRRSSPPRAGSTATAPPCCSRTCTGTTSRACRSSRRSPAGGGIGHRDRPAPGRRARSIDGVPPVMSPPYFPITPEELRGDVAFEAVANDDFAVNGAKVRSRWVRHTDPTLGFRVEIEGVSVAYLSDHGPGHRARRPRRLRPAATCSSSATASTSSSTTRSTPPTSTRSSARGVTAPIEYAMHVAKEAGARELALFHHCPSHGDDELDTILRDARELSAAHQRTRGVRRRRRPAPRAPAGRPLNRRSARARRIRRDPARPRRQAVPRRARALRHRGHDHHRDGRRRAGRHGRQLVHVAVARPAAHPVLRRALLVDVAAHRGARARSR